MLLKQNPYHLLLLTGLALLLVSFFISPFRTLDIHVHDTYYVIAQQQIFWLFAFMVWLLWFIYWWTRKALYSTWLSWIHIILTLLTVLFLLFIIYFSGDIFTPQPGSYVDLESGSSFAEYNRNLRLIGYFTIALLLWQLAFVVNLVIGLYKRLR